ncbi:hypothetical protein M6B38_414515 [Iris pallida]|uniref:Uncharacterized protein n=1 Tax=Iris pallida TaxID=29817 RepID=A0AAX6EY67_IRIPA|nr:hypothetical protein M6B38_161195 [Iris pallida]KAJ6809157.1 hypothetical protein M6B38_161200 [Iris pallida]KAJ6816531.1 hypothetical protein M6B38_414515 [Iris pallida]
MSIHARNDVVVDEAVRTRCGGSPSTFGGSRPWWGGLELRVWLLTAMLLHGGDGDYEEAAARRRARSTRRRHDL